MTLGGYLALQLGSLSTSPLELHLMAFPPSTPQLSAGIERALVVYPQVACFNGTRVYMPTCVLRLILTIWHAWFEVSTGRLHCPTVPSLSLHRFQCQLGAVNTASMPALLQNGGPGIKVGAGANNQPLSQHGASV